MVLDLTLIGSARRYQVRTTTTVQVAQLKFENELLYVVEQRLLSKNPHGYVVQIDIVHATQKADDLFSRVVADANQATRRLVLQTDLYGQLLRVENQAEVQHHWETVRQAVRSKYAAEPAATAFLDTFEQQLAVPGSLEPSLRAKGVHGALLPGLYGQAYGPTPVLTKRCLPGFFNELDLPLLLATTATPVADAPAPTALQVTTTGTLDEEAFAGADFRRLLRSIVDDYTFPVDLTLDCQAQHRLDAQTGELLRSQQRLLAEVPGVYHSQTTHDIFPQPTP